MKWDKKTQAWVRLPYPELVRRARVGYSMRVVEEDLEVVDKIAEVVEQPAKPEWNTCRQCGHRDTEPLDGGICRQH